MAVYKRTYHPYEGACTAERWRFLVLTRYAFADVFKSRFMVAFFVVCFVPTLIALGGVYLTNSETARALLQLNNSNDGLLPIDQRFFYHLLKIQGWFAFVLTAWACPGLISPDLSNGALPLYLSRPISRAEYVLGKMSVLLVLLSAVTWFPLMLVFGLQVAMAPWQWTRDWAYLAPALVASSLIWIVMLSLIALAVSAWVKWRIVATAATFGTFMISAGFAEMVNNILRTEWGSIFSLTHMMTVVHNSLLQMPPGYVFGFGREPMPIGVALNALAVASVAALFVLQKRLRAREVVRG